MDMSIAYTTSMSLFVIIQSMLNSLDSDGRLIMDLSQ